MVKRKTLKKTEALQKMKSMKNNVCLEEMHFSFNQVLKECKLLDYRESKESLKDEMENI